MNAQFIIERATLADAGAIAELSGELGYPVTSAAIRKRLELLFEAPLHRVLVARLSDGTVIGWAHIEHRLSVEGGEKVEISGLVVSKDHRRIGVGRKLVRSGEEWAFSIGSDVVVRSNIIRPEAHSFYARLGYEQIKTQHVYRKHKGRSATIS